jgi:hypothetical protein
MKSSKTLSAIIGVALSAGVFAQETLQRVTPQNFYDGLIKNGSVTRNMTELGIDKFDIVEDVETSTKRWMGQLYERDAVCNDPTHVDNFSLVNCAIDEPPTLVTIIDKNMGAASGDIKLDFNISTEISGRRSMLSEAVESIPTRMVYSDEGRDGFKIDDLSANINDVLVIYFNASPDRASILPPVTYIIGLRKDIVSTWYVEICSNFLVDGKNPNRFDIQRLGGFFGWFKRNIPFKGVKANLEAFNRSYGRVLSGNLDEIPKLYRERVVDRIVTRLFDDSFKPADIGKYQGTIFEYRQFCEGTLPAR